MILWTAAILEGERKSNSIEMRTQALTLDSRIMQVSKNNVHEMAKALRTTGRTWEGRHCARSQAKGGVVRKKHHSKG